MTTPTLKLPQAAEPVAEEQTNRTRREVVIPEVMVMIDIESLATTARPVITQIAALAYDFNEGEMLDVEHDQYYPIQPQLRVIPARTIDADTIAWWMNQSDEARSRIKHSTGDDMDDIPALLRNLVRVFEQMTRGREYIVVSKGPQFDINAVETLMADFGMTPPWRYNKVRDLRTYMEAAGITEDYVPHPPNFVPHVARDDARWQIQMWLAARKAIRAS